jgi:hypothetical protein
MKIFSVSGLGADERVFKYLKLEQEIVPVLWISPIEGESIVNYSKRLIDKYGLVNETNFGILGVSFGGLVAVEISKLTKPKFTILISSVETTNELSRFLRILGKSKIVEWIPKRLFNPPKFMAHYMFGTDKKEMLNSILDDSDLKFTKWAVIELLNWKNKVCLPNLIKVGGSKDKMLPPKGENTVVINQGEHFMIVDKADEISKVLNDNIAKCQE